MTFTRMKASITRRSPIRDVCEPNGARINNTNAAARQPTAGTDIKTTASTGTSAAWSCHERQVKDGGSLRPWPGRKTP